MTVRHLVPIIRLWPANQETRENQADPKGDREAHHNKNSATKGGYREEVQIQREDRNLAEKRRASPYQSRGEFFLSVRFSLLKDKHNCENIL